MSSANVLDHMPAVKSRNPKLVCAATMTLVFLCGGVIGALAMDFGVHSRTRPPAFDTPQGRAAYFDHIQKELELTPQQSEQMQSVLNDLWQYYRSVLTDSKQRVEQLLTAEQRAKFEKILQQQAPR